MRAASSARRIKILHIFWQIWPFSPQECNLEKRQFSKKSYSYSSGKIRAEKMSAAFPSAPADIDDIDHTKPGRNYSCTAKINPALSAKPILHYQQNFLPNLSPGATLK